VLQATSVASGNDFLAPGKANPIFGYGYQVWLLPVERRMFALQGMDGQRISVDPGSKLVLVQTAVSTSDHDPGMREIYASWYALVAQHGKDGFATE
jgi:CubicO group peptidase (beta-lactamase class C family)